MINLNDIHSVSEHVKARAEHMLAVRKSALHDVFVFRVVPYGEEFNHQSKSKRLVTIDALRGTAECVDYDTRSLCPANANFVIGSGKAKAPHLCSHVYAALKRLRAVDEITAHAA